MSVNYSKGLSPYANKGICGLSEVPDEKQVIIDKVEQLYQYMLASSTVVVLCGAGISTTCGIPDFRGPNGVWTLEKLKIKPNQSSLKTNFDEIKPSFTHLFLTQLAFQGIISLIISQNVDGLFLRTGLSRKYLCEVHGNFYLDECNKCLTRFIRKSASSTMGLKVSNNLCQRKNRPCRGLLRDTILDWEDELPESELVRAESMSKKANLFICIGTSLQINPVATFPFLCKKSKSNNGKIVLINLQKTKFDNQVDLCIHGYADDVLKQLSQKLNINVKPFNPNNDLIENSTPNQIY